MNKNYGYSGILLLTIIAMLTILVFFVVRGLNTRDKQILDSKYKNTKQIKADTKPITREKISSISGNKILESRNYANGNCELSIKITDKDNNKIPISEEETGEIKGLNCRNEDHESGYPNPYEVRISDWSSQEDSFLVDFGIAQNGEVLLKKYTVEGNTAKESSQAKVQGDIVGYIPSLKYLLTTDFRVYDYKGLLVEDFKAPEGEGITRNTFLVKNQETFLITSRLEEGATYTEFYYLFNPEIKRFYLAGSKTYSNEQPGIGCPKEYMELDKTKKVLYVVGCANKVEEVSISI